MAVVETLEVRFQADMGNLSAQLKQLTAQLDGISAALDAKKGSLAQNAAGLIAGVADGLRMGAAMTSAPTEAGNALSDRFTMAILNGRAGVAGAARQVSSAALGQGFANGIAGKYGTVMSAVNRIVNAAISRIRSALSIHSPSKVSFELGGFFGEGFADGIYASIRRTEESVNALSAGAQTALSVQTAEPAQESMAGLAGMMRSAVNDALDGTNIVIPLHVDGMKLGEASIQGINRVTRSMGRVMLEI